MSVKSAALCLTLVIVGRPAIADAQSASDVIERYIKAIGGKKAVEQIVTTEVSGTVTSADGRSGVFAQRSKRPHFFSTSVSLGDSIWRVGFNGRAAWQDDGVGGLRTLYGSAAARVRAEAKYASTRFILSEKVNQVTVIGQDDVRGRPAMAVVVIASDGTMRTLFFDATTSLLVKDQQQTDAGMEERFFDDYRRVDEVMEPHRIEWHRNGETFRITVERVTHNATLDDTVFDMPAKPDESALDIDTALAAAARTERPADDSLASYAYTITSSSGKLDKQGHVTERSGASYEVIHVAGRAVPRLVKKRDGEPLSEVERTREDERVNAVIRELERQRLSGDASGRVQGERTTNSGMVIRVPLMSANWLPTYRRMSDFSNIRREQLQGRAVVVVEFQPKPRATPTTEFDRQTSRMAGALWIDEASQHVMRMESYFVDDYERTVQGSSLRIERIRVNDEVWLPSSMETNHRMSFMFGATAQFVSVTQYTDHKKFSVSTDSAMTLPISR